MVFHLNNGSNLCVPERVFYPLGNNSTLFSCKDDTIVFLFGVQISSSHHVGENKQYDDESHVNRIQL